MSVYDVLIAKKEENFDFQSSAFCPFAIWQEVQEFRFHGNFFEWTRCSCRKLEIKFSKDKREAV